MCRGLSHRDAIMHTVSRDAADSIDLPCYVSRFIAVTSHRVHETATMMQ